MSTSQANLPDLLAKKPIECPPNVADCGFNIDDDLDVILDLSTNTRRTVKVIVSAVFIALALFCLFSNFFGLYVVIRVYKRHQATFHLYMISLLAAGCLLVFHFAGMAYPTFSSAFFNIQLNYSIFRNLAFHHVLQYIGGFVHQLTLWTLCAIMIERVFSTFGKTYFESRRFSFLVISSIYLVSIVISVLLNMFECGYYGGSFRDTERSFRCFAIQDKTRWYWIEMIMVAQLLLIDLICTLFALFLILKRIKASSEKPNLQSKQNKQAIVIFFLYQITILLGMVRNYTSINPVHSIRGMVDLRNFTAYDIFKTLEELTPMLYASVFLIILTLVPIYLYFSNRKLLKDKTLSRKNAKRANRVGSATSVSMIYVNIAKAPRNSVVWDKSTMVY